MPRLPRKKNSNENRAKPHIFYSFFLCCAAMLKRCTEKNDPKDRRHRLLARRVQTRISAPPKKKPAGGTKMSRRNESKLVLDQCRANQKHPKLCGLNWPVDSDLVTPGLIVVEKSLGDQNQETLQSSCNRSLILFCFPLSSFAIFFSASPSSALRLRVPSSSSGAGLWTRRTTAFALNKRDNG